jgi:hypothetical protein
MVLIQIISWAKIYGFPDLSQSNIAQQDYIEISEQQEWKET